VLAQSMATDPAN